MLNPFKKKKSSHDSFKKKWEQVFRIWLEYANENELKIDNINICTTSSAMVGAFHFVKHTSVSKGNMTNTEVDRVSDEINPFFNWICGANLREFERLKGYAISPDSDDGRSFIQGCYKEQQDKMFVYVEKIVEMLKKGAGTAAGADVFHTATEELFGEEMFDPLASMQVLNVLMT